MRDESVPDGQAGGGDHGDGGKHFFGTDDAAIKRGGKIPGLWSESLKKCGDFNLQDFGHENKIGCSDIISAAFNLG